MSSLAAEFGSVIQVYQDTRASSRGQDLANWVFQNRAGIGDALMLEEAIADPDEAMVERRGSRDSRGFWQDRKCRPGRLLRVPG